MPKLSVIMPAYNVEDYVVRACESVLNQSFQDLELICVDDGSSDKTGELLDELATRDDRVCVVHQKNQGAPAARNNALARAKGTYIAFFDADDWAEPTMFEEEIAFADAHKLDLVVSGFVIDTFYGCAEPFSETKQKPTRVLAEQIAFRRYAHELFDENLLYTPWNKLFRRSRIERAGLKFEDTFWDDFPFVVAYIRDCVRVGVLEGAWYHFERARVVSETTRYQAEMFEKRNTEHEMLLDLYGYWGMRENKAVQEFLARRYVERLLGCLENACKREAKLTRSQRKHEVKRILSSKYARDAFEVAQIKGTHTKLLLLPIKHRWAGVAMLEGKFLAHMRSKHAKQFAKYKANR